MTSNHDIYYFDHESESPKPYSLFISSVHSPKEIENWLSLFEYVVYIFCIKKNFFFIIMKCMHVFNQIYLITE